MSSTCNEVIQITNNHFTECNNSQLATHGQAFPKRSFKLKSDHYEAFWKDYLDMIELSGKGKITGSINLTEKITNFIPVIADCTMKFDINNNESPVPIKEAWLQQIILETVLAYQSAITETLVTDPNESDENEYNCVVLEPNESEERTIHYRIHFPYCRVEPNVLKRVIRYKAIQILNKKNVLRYCTPHPTGGWDTIISSTISDGFLPLYGSVSDFKQLPLHLTNCYCKIEANSIEEGGSLEYLSHELNEFFLPKTYSAITSNLMSADSDLFERLEGISENDYESGELMYYLPMFLSIDYTNKCMRTKHGIDVNEIKNNQRGYNDTPPTVNTNEIMIEDDLIIIEQLLKMLSPERINNRHYWVDICKAIYNSDKSEDKKKARNLCHKFSENLDNFDSEWAEDIFDDLGVDNPITVRTVAWYARLDSKKEYDKWHQQRYKPFLRRSLSCTHDDVAQAFYQIYWLDFICGSVKNKTWYIFNNHILREADSGREIRLKMSSDFKHYYEVLQFEISLEIKNTDDEHRKTALQQDIKKINDLIKKLKTVTYKSSIVTNLLDLFKDDNFERYANTNPNLMGIDGGIVECTNEYAVLREGKPEDYCTMASTVKLNPKFSWNHPQVRKVMKWMGQVFVDEPMMTYFLVLMAACLRSKNVNKLLGVLTGMGDNSKSMIKKWIEAMFGPYSVTFPSYIFTEKSKKGPSPELVAAKFAKICFCTEPASDSHMQAEHIKSHTGMDRMRGRNNYENGGEFDVMYTLFFMCNSIPIITGIDKAVMKRLKIVPFESTWALDAPSSEEEQYKLRRFKVDFNFEAQIPHLAGAGLWVLIQYFAEYMKEGLKEPPTVGKATRRYFKENDLYDRFIRENIDRKYIPGTQTSENEKGDKDPSFKVSITDLYQIFKGWSRTCFSSLKIPDNPVFMYHMLQLIGKPVKKEYIGIAIKESITEKDKVAKI